jgi:hypothetical protein
MSTPNTTPNSEADRLDRRHGSPRALPLPASSPIHLEIAGLAQAARQPVPKERMIINHDDSSHAACTGVSPGVAHAATTAAAPNGRSESVPMGRAAAYRTIGRAYLARRSRVGEDRFRVLLTNNR